MGKLKSRPMGVEHACVESIPSTLQVLSTSGIRLRDALDSDDLKIRWSDILRRWLSSLDKKVHALGISGGKRHDGGTQAESELRYALTLLQEAIPAPSTTNDASKAEVEVEVRSSTPDLASKLYGYMAHG